MKLVLNSAHEDARRLFRAYGGFTSERDGRFIFEDVNGNLHHAKETEAHLSTATPDIYACMREGLKVEVVLVTPPACELEPRYFNLSRGGHRSVLMAELSKRSIKSIRILGIEDMNGVTEVEG